MRLLIIGLENVKGATQSFSWETCVEKCPVVGDFDKVIFNLPTFQLNFAQTNILKNVLRPKIYEALKSDTDFYCLTSSSLRGGDNYSIFPFRINPRDEAGEVFIDKINDDYFNKVTKWDFCFDNLVSGIDTFIPKYSTVAFRALAKTRHSCLVAFLIHFKSDYYAGAKGIFYFIPPQNDESNENNIRNLIEWIDPGTEDFPVFLEDVEVFGEGIIKKKIAEHEQKMTEISKLHGDEVRDLGKLQFKKGILAFKGKQLVRSITNVFNEMGLVLDGVENFEEDKMFIFKNSRIPVEIKGRDKNVPEKDLVQAYGRVVKAEVPADAPVRGLLITNSHAQTSLKERGRDFDNNIAKRAIALGICLLSTRVIFEYWNDFRKTGRTNLAQFIMETPGVLKFKKLNN